MRLDHRQVFPQLRSAMGALEQAVRSAGIEPELIELVKLRASQMNGCAPCVAMHTRELAALSVDVHRMHMVVVWRDADCFSEWERAALPWTEALTLISGARHVDDALYTGLFAQLTPPEQVAVTVAGSAIGIWNRLNVAFETPVDR